MKKKEKKWGLDKQYRVEDGYRLKDISKDFYDNRIFILSIFLTTIKNKFCLLKKLCQFDEKKWRKRK